MVKWTCLFSFQRTSPSSHLFLAILDQIVVFLDVFLFHMPFPHVFLAILAQIVVFLCQTKFFMCFSASTDRTTFPPTSDRAAEAAETREMRRLRVRLVKTHTGIAVIAHSPCYRL